MITAKEALEKEVELKKREIKVCEEIIASVASTGYSRREKEIAVRMAQQYLDNSNTGLKCIEEVLSKLT